MMPARQDIGRHGGVLSNADHHWELHAGGWCCEACQAGGAGLGD